MFEELPTRQQITIAQIAHHAQILHLAMIMGGDSQAPAYAESIAFNYSRTVLASHKDTNLCDFTRSLKSLSERLETLAGEVERIADHIEDADMCYRDPSLSNDRFDKLPQWARDMIREAASGTGVRRS